MNCASKYRVAGSRNAAGIKMLFIIVLLTPPALGNEIAYFNVYDKDFSRLVATAESITSVNQGIRHYSIRYFDVRNLPVYEQTVAFNPQTLEIVSGGFTDYQNRERASYAVLDEQTSITIQNSDRKEETRIRPSADYDYGETILARIIHDLPALKQGNRMVLNMFVPSENRTVAFEYFLDGEMSLMGRSYTRVRARADNWLYNLVMPRIQFLVAKDESSIPVFYGPADFYKNKTRGVWIVNRDVDKFSSSPNASRHTRAGYGGRPDEN